MAQLGIEPKPTELSRTRRLRASPVETA
jgi:hypothetical protein